VRNRSLPLAATLEDEKADGVCGTADEADEAVWANVTVIARRGDDCAGDGGQPHGYPGQGGGVSVKASLSLIAAARMIEPTSLSRPAQT